MTSRRGFLKGPAALAAAAFAAGRPGRIAYVATYSSPQGAEGSPGRGRGIHVFSADGETGALEPRAVVPNGSNPSCLAIDPSRRHLYSANETANGSVSAYAIVDGGLALRLLNTAGSEGAGPCYLSVHPSGSHVFVANYAGGSVVVLPVRADGSLGPATDVKKWTGPAGPARATNAPPGSFAISGHERPHGHMIESDPGGRFVLACDLGTDRILVWRFDAAGGTLRDTAVVPLPAGDGPRHFAFHPNGRCLYSLQEEASTLVRFDYDPATGRLAPTQTISTLPRGFAGTNFTSEVAVSSDGRFVYAANRLHDTIAWFSVDREGRLAWAGEEWTRGDYPRSFTLGPAGRFLYCANQRSDAITLFAVHRPTGALRFTGRYTAVGTPSMLVFL